MKQLNRILLTLVLAMALLLAWNAAAHTTWASSVSLLGIGDNYTNAFQPLLKVAAATTVAVTAVQLIKQGARWFQSPRKAGGKYRSDGSSWGRGAGSEAAGL
jgi:hypothetical protein